MIFGSQMRSSKTTALFVGAVFFIAIFVGLVYNHMDTFQDVSSGQVPPPSVDDSNTLTTPPQNDAPKEPPVAPPKQEEHTHDEPKQHEEEHTHDQPKKPQETTAPKEADPKPASPPPNNDDTTIPDIPMSDPLKFYFGKMFKSTQKVDERKYRAWGGVEYVVKDSLPMRWKEPRKEKICIIDLDNRPFNESGQAFGPTTMSWDDADKVHGLSLGLLNHWAYAKIHGYKYYYIDIEAYTDRRNSWKKPPVMSQILKDHEACIYLDSDAIFNQLDLPFEWLMNYWGLHPSNNSLALAYDPNSDNNKDEFGQVYLNTGFIVAQNNKKTFEIMDAWEHCPDEGSKHPKCVDFRYNEPGHPTDQGGFGTYTRYDYPEHITSLECTEANGFPESHSGCDGTFIRHLWTGKESWIKANVGRQMPGPYLEEIHKQYLADKKNFFMTEKELMNRGRA